MSKIVIVQAQTGKISSPEEYLEWEVRSGKRHEYIRGKIIEMTGGTPNHNQIALNLSGSLNFALRKHPYRVFVADQRLWIPQAQIYTYPDIMVVSQPLEYAEDRRDTLTNPLLIGEVLSKSTRAHDKDEKFMAYRTISSFQEYLLVDQYRIHVEHYSKIESRKWTFIEHENPGAIVSLSSVNFQIEIAEIYDKVDFDIEG